MHVSDPHPIAHGGAHQGGRLAVLEGWIGPASAALNVGGGARELVGLSVLVHRIVCGGRASLAAEVVHRVRIDARPRERRRAVRARWILLAAAAAGNHHQHQDKQEQQQQRTAGTGANERSGLRRGTAGAERG